MAHRQGRLHSDAKDFAQRHSHDGYNISQIARHLGLHRETVRKNFYATSFPERKQRKPAASILDPYLPYLEERHWAGCENGMQLSCG